MQDLCRDAFVFPWVCKCYHHSCCWVSRVYSGAYTNLMGASCTLMCSDLRLFNKCSFNLAFRSAAHVGVKTSSRVCSRRRSAAPWTKPTRRDLNALQWLRPIQWYRSEVIVLQNAPVRNRRHLVACEQRRFQGEANKAMPPPPRLNMCEVNSLEPKMRGEFFRETNLCWVL